MEVSRTQAHLQQEIVIKDQTIASLAADKNELENANIALSRSYEAVQRELDRALRNQSQTHQHAVEVRMQGIIIIINTNDNIIIIIIKVLILRLK